MCPAQRGQQTGIPGGDHSPATRAKGIEGIGIGSTPDIIEDEQHCFVGQKLGEFALSLVGCLEVTLATEIPVHAPL